MIDQSVGIVSRRPNPANVQIQGFVRSSVKERRSASPQLKPMRQSVATLEVGVDMHILGCASDGKRFVPAQAGTDGCSQRRASAKEEPRSENKRKAPSPPLHHCRVALALSKYVTLALLSSVRVFVVNVIE